MKALIPPKSTQISTAPIVQSEAVAPKSAVIIPGKKILSFINIQGSIS